MKNKILIRSKGKTLDATPAYQAMRRAFIKAVKAIKLRQSAETWADADELRKDLER